MKYTDKELIRASQIAYLTINYEVLKEAYDTIETLNEKNTTKNINLNYTLSELLKYSDTFKRSAYKDIANMAGLEVDYVINNSGSEEDINNILSLINDDVKEERAREKYKIIDAIKTGKIGSWKVVSYVDNNTIGVGGKAGKLVNGTWVHCA